MIREIISPATENIRGRKEISIPAFFCSSCTSCQGNYCSFYDRHVLPNLNRCKNHTYYHPMNIKFKAPKNLEEIMERERLKIA